MSENTNLFVIKTNRNKNYSLINLNCVQDKNLSWKAKGIHSYFITRPNNWEIKTKDLFGRSTNGIKSLYSGVNELITAKYLFRIQKRDKKKQIKKHGYFATEAPSTVEEIKKLLDEEWEMVTSLRNSEKLQVQKVLVAKCNVYRDNKDNKGDNKDPSSFVSEDLRSDPETKDCRFLERQFTPDLDIYTKDPNPKLLQTISPVVKPRIYRESIDPFKLFTNSAKELFLFWNSLGKPLPFHRTDLKSKTFVRSLKHLDKLLLKYSESEIMRSMENYKFVLEIDPGVLSFSMGRIVSLEEFMEFSGLLLKKRIKRNPLLIGMDSWFLECLKPREELVIKWSKIIPDEHSEETKELKRLWKEFGGRKLDAVDDENTFRRISKRAYDYFESLNGKYQWGITERYPINRMHYLFDVLQAEDQNWEYMQPQFLLSPKMFSEKLPMYWNKICMPEALTKYDLYEIKNKGITREINEFNSHFSYDQNNSREKTLAIIAAKQEELRKNPNQDQDQNYDYDECCKGDFIKERL